MTDDLADNAKVQFVICIIRRIAIVVVVGWAMRICLRGSTYANFGGKFKAVLLSALNARLSTCLFVWLCVYLCLFACVCLYLHAFLLPGAYTTTYLHHLYDFWREIQASSSVGLERKTEYVLIYLVVCIFMFICLCVYVSSVRLLVCALLCACVSTSGRIHMTVYPHHLVLIHPTYPGCRGIAWQCLQRRRTT